MSSSKYKTLMIGSSLLHSFVGRSSLVVGVILIQHRGRMCRFQQDNATRRAGRCGAAEPLMQFWYLYCTEFDKSPNIQARAVSTRRRRYPWRAKLALTLPPWLCLLRDTVCPHAIRCCSSSVTRKIYSRVDPGVPLPRTQLRVARLLLGLPWREPPGGAHAPCPRRGGLGGGLPVMWAMPYGHSPS